MTTKNRAYNYITLNEDDSFSNNHRNIQSDDSFTGEIFILAFHITLLSRSGEILSLFNLNNDHHYFYEQARSVLSVPEKHMNEKGEGKLTFQSYFTGIPHSLASINDSAIVVVALHPLNDKTFGNRNYRMISYIHANLMDFQNIDGSIQQYFYYNVLRISEFSENGEKLYRRKRIFSLIFSVLHDLVDVSNIHFAYAAMGKENQAIDEALKMNSDRYNKHWEKFYVRNNTHINLIFGSKSDAKKLVDISNHEKSLNEMHRLLMDDKLAHIFYPYYTFELFQKLVRQIQSYSKTSRVFMIPKADGSIDAAMIALNWGDYFSLKLENPKGFYKFVDNLKISDKILYPILLTGSAKGMKTLLKGAAYYFRKKHGVHITLLNSFPGDPYEKCKKSIIYDNYQFFIISDRTDWLEKLKNKSEQNDGNVKFFIEHPIL
jgi:hypothetical protein